MRCGCVSAKRWNTRLHALDMTIPMRADGRVESSRRRQKIISGKMSESSSQCIIWFQFFLLQNSPNVCAVHVDVDPFIRATVLQLAIHPPVAMPSIVPCALWVHALGGILFMPLRKPTPVLPPEASGKPFRSHGTTRRCFFGGSLVHCWRELEPMVLPKLHSPAIHHRLSRHLHCPCCV